MTNIKEKLQKINSYEKDIILVLIILCVGLTAFGLGRLSAVTQQKLPVTVEKPTASLGAVSNTVVNEQLLVASKNGTKYHYPWCSGAQRIKEENKIWFSSQEEAEKSGYGPASNCKGL